MEDIIRQIGNQALYAKKLQQSLANINKRELEPIKRLSLLTDEIKKINDSSQHLLVDASFKENIETIVNSIKSEIFELVKVVKADFGRKLADKLRESGFELEGHYPNLKTFIYTLNVDININKVDIYYGPEFEKLETTKADPDKVFSKIIDSHKRITQREFDDNTFLANLLKSYKLCLILNNKEPGEAVNVSDILPMYAYTIQEKKFKQNPLKKYYSEYTRTFFSYDLFRLKTRKIENFELRLVTATRADTKKKSNFIWIPPVEGKGLGESISGVKFKEV